MLHLKKWKYENGSWKEQPAGSWKEQPAGSWKEQPAVASPQILI